MQDSYALFVENNTKLLVPSQTSARLEPCHFRPAIFMYQNAAVNEARVKASIIGRHCKMSGRYFYGVAVQVLGSLQGNSFFVQHNENGFLQETNAFACVGAAQYKSIVFVI